MTAPLTTIFDPEHAEAVERIQANMGKITLHAIYFSKSFHHPIEDLIAVGQLAILRAMQTFDPARGVKFLSYADFFIRRYMQTEVEKFSRTVRVPRHLFHLFPTREQSLDDLLTDDSEDTAEKFFSVEEQATSYAERNDLLGHLPALLARLSPVDRGVIQLWLAGRKDANVAARFHVTQQAISHRRRKAFRQLRQWFDEL
ncbi:MAG: hypothetical protein ABS95_01150 [Verrucomicrobia bacterium SCN 57-15]|nr:MAG: hypothetical protein ABS95_01150 [Verrucomicrobia bacterium SCN 57-15]